MARLLSLFFSVLFFFSVTLSHATTQYHFQPLKNILENHGITRIPDESDYPDVPAIAVLSFQEYKQSGQKHSRRYHKIIKILTPQGKEYANVHVPCFSTCHIEARTIKPDGKIVHLPARDLHRNENRSGYHSPYFVAQFALPGVEPGDMIEYVATVDYPNPLYLEDFRFSESYPILKGVLVLSHPSDDGYAYTRFSPPGGPSVQVRQSQLTEGSLSFTRTIFVVDNVPAALEESNSPRARQDVPSVRLVLDVRGGSRFEIFKDWFSFGRFVNDQIPSDSGDIQVLEFAAKAAGNLQDVRAILSSIYMTAEEQIRISDETPWATGFEFQKPSQVLKTKSASPHDFALFLAVCFRMKRWSSDLVLVNSHQQSETSKDKVFPPDLDLVFLNVKTPIGEFFLDCTKNGLPPFQLSSAGMNRFALGIPLFGTKTGFASSNCYTSRTSYRSGNQNRVEIVAIPGSDFWNLEFRWILGGELQSDWVRFFRESSESDFRARLEKELRSRLEVIDLKEMTYTFTTAGLEVRGKAFRPIRKSEAIQVLQNDFWDAGFDMSPFLFQNRVNPVLLPVAGEFSTTLRIRTSANVVTPENSQLEAGPASYSLSFQRDQDDLLIEERLSFKDIQVKQNSFSEFEDFLSRVYEKHFWAILLS